MTNDIDASTEAARDAIGHEDFYGAIRALEPALARLHDAPAARRGAVLATFADALALRFDGEVPAAREAAAAPGDVAALGRLGYLLVERGLPELAEPVLRAAVAVAPSDAGALHELVAALERLGRYGAAVAALDAAPAGVSAHPLTRFLRAFHGALLGDLAPARAAVAGLRREADPRRAYLGERLHRLVARADAISDQDVGVERAQLFTVSGAMLLADHDGAGSFGAVRDLLDRVVAVLGELGCHPEAVGALADRDSQIVGRALGFMLGAPVTTWYSGGEPGLVVAWDLASALPEQLAHLRRRPASGQVLVAMTASGDAESEVAPDLLGFLGGDTGPPWGGGGAELSFSLDDDDDESPPADDRSADELAEALVAAEPEGDDADRQRLDALVAAAGGVPRELAGPAFGGEHERERRWRRAAR